MIKTVQEGIEKYKSMLRDYVAWIGARSSYCDRVFGKGKWSAFANWSNSEYRELEQRSAELRAVINILGLTREEEAAIDKECGVKSTAELNAD